MYGQRGQSRTAYIGMYMSIGTDRFVCKVYLPRKYGEGFRVINLAVNYLGTYFGKGDMIGPIIGAVTECIRI